ncbi:hypothetical protein CKO36_18270 [Rhabdochromatium marinum]|nr:hypothetical protein [Rhabdochromatium marinum]
MSPSLANLLKKIRGREERIMARYSEEHRAAVVAKLLPPQSLSSQAVAEQEGLSLATVYIAVIYDLQTF